MAARKLIAFAALVAVGAVAPAALAATDAPSGGRIATGPSAGVAASTVRISTAGAAVAERRAQSSAAAVTVTMGDYYFRPRDVTISAGEAVSWTNRGKVPEGHTATGDGFDSGVLEQGESYTHTFSTEGSFDYVCTLHQNMKGTVTVTAAADSGAGANDPDSVDLLDGDGGSPTTTPDSTGSGGTSALGGSGGSLPTTGLNLILLAEIGSCLLAGGALVRKLVRA